MDSGESQLGILDFIQRFVEALDAAIPNVCELDLMTNFNLVHSILDEMIVGGFLLETGAEIFVSFLENVLEAHAVAESSIFRG